MYRSNYKLDRYLGMELVAGAVAGVFAGIVAGAVVPIVLGAELFIFAVFPVLFFPLQRA